MHLPEKIFNGSVEHSVYQVVVLSSLLYGCEIWMLQKILFKNLEHFHLRILQSIMSFSRQDQVENLELLDRQSQSGQF
uniref:Uncharacterized protein n=1 Tax=Octopus bimaculoides TaxID=37653 RepID=A0A0L8FL10_OCTBM